MRQPHRRDRFVQSIVLVAVGLAGSAVLDKILALQGNATAVAEWAQLSGAAAVVSGASLSGMGVALTALAAGSGRQERLEWLKPALVACTALSLAVGLVGLPILLLAAPSLVPRHDAWLLPAAIAAAVTGISPGVWTAYLRGTGELVRASVVTILATLPAVVLVLWSPLHPLSLNLLVAQMLVGVMVTAGLAVALRGRPPVSRRAVSELLRFMPAGLSIGILGPAALVWARSEIAGSLDWHAVGQVQAIWRASDWVTAIAAGLLNAYVLPRLGAARDRAAFLGELRASIAWIVLPAGAALGLLWWLLPEALGVLYRADLGVTREDGTLFLLGDWMRIVSWVPLFGLFAFRAAWAIALGELLSLPLFAALLALRAPAGLADVGLLWLLTYAAYALFNGWILRRRLSALPPAR